CGLHEAVGDLAFGLTQNDASLTLALSLRLPGHGIFQTGGNFYVANLDRLHHDAPRVRLLIENALQLAAESFALGDHLREFVAADRLAQRGLRAESNGLDKVLDFENGFLCVPDQPEND